METKKVTFVCPNCRGRRDLTETKTVVEKRRITHLLVNNDGELFADGVMEDTPSRVKKVSYHCADCGEPAYDGDYHNGMEGLQEFLKTLKGFEAS